MTEPVISVHQLNHYFGEGELRKQALFDINLDIFAGEIVMQKLAKEQGCTILLVTHDNRILDIADRIVYMEDGRLADKSNAAALVE